MQRTTRVQNTAEITLLRLSATVTAAIILPDCQVRRGLPCRVSPLLCSDCQRSYALRCRDGGKSSRRRLQIAQGRVDVEVGCPGAAVIIIILLILILIMSCRGVHQFMDAAMQKSEVVEILHWSLELCLSCSWQTLMSDCHLASMQSSLPSVECVTVNQV